MNGPAPATSSIDGAAMLGALAPVDGEGSGLDADKLRGRDGVTALWRLSFAPLFTAPPGFGEVMSSSLFGV